MEPGEFERHFWLTRSVARMIGVNLSDAMADARISADDYCDMVTTCMRCECRETCESWLAAQPGKADRAPDHCANAPVLNRLIR